MEEIYKNPFENMKKISLNMDSKTLDLIDDLTVLLKTTRTMVISALIAKGIKNLFNDLEKGWKDMKKDKSKDQKKINSCLEGIEKLKKKWKIEQY